MTGDFIFANNGTFFLEMIVSLSSEVVPGLTKILGMAFRWKGTYVVDGGRYSLIVESLDVEITPEDVPELEAFEEEAEAATGTLPIG